MTVSPEELASALRTVSTFRAISGSSTTGGEVGPLLVGEPATSIDDIVDDFFEGGFTQAIGSVLLAISLAIFDGGVAPGPGQTASLPSTLVDGFFFGYPTGDDAAGFVAVARILWDATFGGGLEPSEPAPAPLVPPADGEVAPMLVGDPTDNIDDVVDDFFEGGFTQAIGNVLLRVSLEIFDGGVEPGPGQTASLPTTLVDGFFFGYPSADDAAGFVAVARILWDATFGGGIEPTPVEEEILAVDDLAEQTPARSGLFGADQTNNPAAGSFQLPTPKNLLERLAPRQSSPAEEPAENTATDGVTESPTPESQEEQAPPTFGARLQEGIADFREAVADQREKVRESLKFSPGSSEDTELTDGGTSGSGEAKSGWKPGDGLKKLGERLRNGGKSNDGQTESSEQGSGDGE